MQSTIRTVIIAVTASAFEDERTVALTKDCDDFLRKPFQEAEIFEMIQRHLGVRYLYEKDRQTELLAETRKEGLLPSALQTLPLDLLERLEQALIIADLSTVHRVIEDIHDYDTTLAEALTRLINNFDYAIILEHIQQIKKGTDIEQAPVE